MLIWKGKALEFLGLHYWKGVEFICWGRRISHTEIRIEKSTKFINFSMRERERGGSGYSTWMKKWKSQGAEGKLFGVLKGKKIAFFSLLQIIEVEAKLLQVFFIFLFSLWAWLIWVLGIWFFGRNWGRELEQGVCIPTVHLGVALQGCENELLQMTS